MQTSTPADFERVFREQSAEYVPLPSGLTVLAYRPSPEWWARHRDTLPMGLAANGQEAPTPDSDTDSQALVELAKWTLDIILEIVLEPKLSLTPQAGELHPNRILNKDLEHLLHYATGRVSADGRDLTAFR